QFRYCSHQSATKPTIRTVTGSTESILLIEAANVTGIYQYRTRPLSSITARAKSTPTVDKCVKTFSMPEAFHNRNARESASIRAEVSTASSTKNTRAVPDRKGRR